MSKEDRIEIEKISNQLFELKYWLSEQPGHPTHLSNLPQWFWESWGEYIDDLKRLSKPKQKEETPLCTPDNCRHGY